MAFVQVTDRLNGFTRHISAEHVAQVHDDGEAALIYMAVSGREGQIFYYLKESSAEVVSRIELALQYRRGR